MGTPGKNTEISQEKDKPEGQMSNNIKNENEKQKSLKKKKQTYKWTN